MKPTVFGELKDGNRKRNAGMFRGKGREHMSDSIIFGSGSRERNKVLIIDDTEMNRVLLKMIFEDEYQVVEAENGAEGLKKLREGEDSICMVLLDVVMPVMDGMKFLEQFMTNPVSEQIPVFLITAEADSNVIRRA